MNASATSRRSSSLPLVQPLESRCLFDGTWTTVDTDTTSYDILGMTADKVGNVYAIGVDNANNANLRQGSGSVWSTAITVADGGATNFGSVAADTDGDVFITGGGPGGGTIWHRPAGQSNLVVIDSSASQTFYGIAGIATDSAGN